jgi:hypothetical protein
MRRNGELGERLLMLIRLEQLDYAAAWGLATLLLSFVLPFGINRLQRHPA